MEWRAHGPETLQPTRTAMNTAVLIRSLWLILRLQSCGDLDRYRSGKKKRLAGQARVGATAERAFQHDGFRLFHLGEVTRATDHAHHAGSTGAIAAALMRNIDSMVQRGIQNCI